MIKYRKGCFGLYVLPSFSGTSWPHGVIPGLLSATIGLILGQFKDFNDFVSDEDSFVVNAYPYQLFAYLVGIVLVFRTNFGYSRYWEAYDAVQRMAAKWLDGACMAIAFDAKGAPSLPFLQSSIVSDARASSINSQALNYSRSMPTAPAGGTAPAAGMDHLEFFVEIVHLFSLMHALALQHLRCDSNLDHLESSSEPAQTSMRLSQMGDLPRLTSSDSVLTSLTHQQAKQTANKLKVLGGLLAEEREAMECDSGGNLITTVARVTMVESWIMRRMIARHKHEPAGDMCKTAPPILSRMVQVVSDGNLGFGQASKSAETPFPFPYHNMIRMFLMIFTLTCPFIINSKVIFPAARFIINFIAVWAYFALAEASDNLEDPYMPYDPNDLPLEAIQHSFNARLLSYGVIPGSDN